MTPQQLAELKALCEESATPSAAHVIRKLIAEVERLREENEKANTELGKQDVDITVLRAQLDEAAEVIEVCLPIVEAAFWDQHTAGSLPGSGYNHKAERLAGLQWGWRESGKFSEWLKNARAFLASLDGSLTKQGKKE